MHRQRPASKRFLSALALALVLAALPWALGSAGTADASHPHPQSDKQHIVGLHYSSPGYGPWDEDYCPQSYTTAMTTDDLRAKLGTLIYNHGWDLLGGGRVDDYPTNYSCESYNLDASSWLEIRISVIDDTSAYGCGTSSCVNFAFPYYENYVYKHYSQGRIWLKTSNVNPLSSQSATATINHEFGHVLGLLDGGGAECGISIMHQFSYCGYPPGGPYVLWPAQVDLDSVVNNVMPLH